jgi:hypothetical protein
MPLRFNSAKDYAKHVGECDRLRAQYHPDYVDSRNDRYVDLRNGNRPADHELDTPSYAAAVGAVVLAIILYVVGGLNGR